MTLARQQGWASSVGEVIEGLSAVAAPVVMRGRLQGVVAVVYAGRNDRGDELGARLNRAATAIVRELELRLTP